MLLLTLKRVIVIFKTTVFCSQQLKLNNDKTAKTIYTTSVLSPIKLLEEYRKWRSAPTVL